MDKGSALVDQGGSTVGTCRGFCGVVEETTERSARSLASVPADEDFADDRRAVPRPTWLTVWIVSGCR